jgi:hypothetical protein
MTVELAEALSLMRRPLREAVQGLRVIQKRDLAE